jgi:hypothetical protein
MTTQWHPIFAHLLRPLVETYYEVQTGVPVGDAPRAADIVLLRRISAGVPPFTGLWRWLTPWNVLEFKGPTVSARVDDLDALLELGLGIHRRLNEEGAKQGRPRVGRSDVSLWYLANHLGRRFLRDAQNLLGPLEELGPGVWRVSPLQRRLLLVSGRAVPVDRDSLPVHLLALEPEEQKRAVVGVLGRNPDLLRVYGSWLAIAYPALAREVTHMGRTKGKKFALDFRPLIREVGWREIIRQTGLKSLVEAVGVKPLIDEVGLKSVIDEVGLKPLIDEVGLKPVIDEAGLDQFVAQLTPRQRRELQRLLKEAPPTREGPGGG